MGNYQSLSQTKWECLSHLVWIPKYRKKKLFLGIRKELGPGCRDLARRKAWEVVEGHLLPDHIHMLVSVPPKDAVSQVVGYITGKSAIIYCDCANGVEGRKRNFTGQHFWARGYWGSTVGRDEEAIREDIRHQEVEDRRIDQLSLLPEQADQPDAEPLPRGGCWCSHRFERFTLTSLRLCRRYLTSLIERGG